MIYYNRREKESKMRHLVSGNEVPEFFSVGVWGPSVPCRGAIAEVSFWGRADVLVLRGSRSSLLAVRVAFGLLPGVFAAGVVRAIDYALSPAPVSSLLPGV
jgi:hypothetical protein